MPVYFKGYGILVPPPYTSLFLISSLPGKALIMHVESRRSPEQFNIQQNSTCDLEADLKFENSGTISHQQR